MEGSRIAKPLVFVLCLGPLAWLALVAAAGGLGANPIEATNRFLGDWALRFLLIALAVTPLRELTARAGLMRYRRMLGLFAFAYAVLHVSSYLVLDQFFAWGEIWADIVKRRYITLGMITFGLLAPLAATSTKGMVRRLGARRWKQLHRLVYVAGVGAVVHYAMMVKADLRAPLIHGAILALLLGWRMVAGLRRRAARSRRADAGARTPASGGTGGC